MNTLAEKIVSDGVSTSEKKDLIHLVQELMGGEKQWLSCLRKELVLPEEVASGIMSNLYTAENGRFKNGNQVNFDKEPELGSFLKSLT